MNEIDERDEQESGIFKTIALIIGVIAFLAGIAAALVVIKRKITEAMSKINKDTCFEPYNEEDLTSTDAFPDKEN